MLTPTAARIARTNYDALAALRNRMAPGDVAWDTINARVEEARQAMKGMPDDMITLGELHTAFRCVHDHGPVSSKRVGSAIQSSTVRAGNALRQLEDAGLVHDHEGEWVAFVNDLSPEEANGAFDAAFPGLGTTTKTKPPRSKSAQPNKEPIMATATTTGAFTLDKGKPAGVKAEQVAKMIGALQKSKDPIAFDTLCKQVGAKYPQDVQAAMFALDIIGAVKRYTFVEEGSTRSRVAYGWVAADDNEGETDDAARPTKSTSTASKPRSRRTKKTEEAPEATPAAA
jgi:hypothetical protein